MGGESGIHDWRAASPPLAWTDRIHLTDEGYAASAEALFGSLLRAYDTWRETRAGR
jgi:lysophospholipase L1-like esterase